MACCLLDGLSHWRVGLCACRGGAHLKVCCRSKTGAALALGIMCCTAHGTLLAGCDETNTTDLAAVSFDLQPPTALIPFPRGYFLIRNVGSSATRLRIYFDIYEVDEAQNELAYIKMVYNDNVVSPGEELLRAITFTPFHMSVGRRYKGVVRYECDAEATNNALYQIAFNLPGETIFEDGFDDEAG